MQIEISIIDVFKYGSLVINAVVAYYWFKDQIIPDRNFSGHWRGDLRYDNIENEILKCDLYLSNHQSHQNTGLLYYKRVNVKNDKELKKGVDRLSELRASSYLFQSRQMFVTFIRVFERKNDEIELENDQAIFDFICRYERIFFKPKVYVEYKFKTGGMVSGCWYKV